MEFAHHRHLGPMLPEWTERLQAHAFGGADDALEDLTDDASEHAPP